MHGAITWRGHDYVVPFSR